MGEIQYVLFTPTHPNIIIQCARKSVCEVFSFCMKYLKSVMYFIMHLSLNQPRQSPCLGTACGTASLIGKTALGGSELFGGAQIPLAKPSDSFSECVYMYHGLIRECVIFELLFHFFLNIHSGVELLDYMVALFSVKFSHQFTSPAAV